MVIPCNDRWSLQRSTLSCKRRAVKERWKRIYCARKKKKNIHMGFMSGLSSKSSWHSPPQTPQRNVLHRQNHKHAEREILCLDMFWIHFIFNDRLTLILHISGLSTQWQVHMVCFSEMHPNPPSQPHVVTQIHFFFIFFFLSPPSGSSSWSGTELGLSGIDGAVFRCQGPLSSSSEHHTTPVRENQMLF